jgi:hypothetical protein
MSRKQQWRRQVNVKRLAPHDFLYKEGIEERDSGGRPVRSRSEPSIGRSLLNAAGLGHVWATTGNLLWQHGGDDTESSLTYPPSSSSSAGMGTANNIKARRRVTYLPTVRVVLIPSRNEYREAGMAPQLWWEDVDYTQVPSPPFFPRTATCIPVLNLFFLWALRCVAVQSVGDPGTKSLDGVEKYQRYQGRVAGEGLCLSTRRATINRLAHTYSVPR